MLSNFTSKFFQQDQDQFAPLAYFPRRFIQLASMSAMKDRATVGLTSFGKRFLSSVLCVLAFSCGSATAGAPTISDIANQSTNRGVSTAAIPFTVGDAETAASSLTVSASSSNQALVPNSNIVFGGSGANRTVTVTPKAFLNGEQSGVATITITVSDGGLTNSDTFVLTSIAPAGTVVAWGHSSTTNVPAGLTGVTALWGGGTGALKGDGTAVAWGPNDYGQADVPAGLSGVTAISATSHTVALKSDGTVVAWGRNDYGQTNVPAGLNGVTAIAGGGEQHTVVLKSDGTVGGWGGNEFGQISVPLGLSGVIAIAGGWTHTLALKNDGTVVAWGGNEYGQINVPVGLTGVTAIAAGVNHSLALKSDGTVVAWGDNGWGQTNVPVGLSGVTAIAGGNSHSVALKSNGTVVTWGSGQTNTGVYPEFGQAIVPAGLTGVTAIAAGHYHTVALTNANPPTISGIADQSTNRGVSTAAIPFNVGDAETAAASLTVSASSSNQALVPNSNIVFGGSGANRTVTMTPKAFLNGGQSGIATITITVSDGGLTTSDTFVLTSIAPAGTVEAWGWNQYGQTTVPAGLSGITAVAAGLAHTVALKSDGTVVAWGSNAQGQTDVPPGLNGVAAIAAGELHTVALKSDGTVVAWGSNAQGQTDVPPGLNGVMAIAAGGGHTVALKSDGTVVVWGSDQYHQMTVPTGLTEVTAIAAGRFNTVALKSDGSLVAWGAGMTSPENWPEFGQSIVPVGLTGVAAIAGGGGHTLALTSNGEVVAWGYNGNGQTNVPVGLAGVAAIAAGVENNLILKNDGTVAAWGLNTEGQTVVPVGLSGVTAIASGFEHTVALTSLAKVLTVSPVSHGTITGGGTFAPGATATLTATPDAGYIFVSWTGSASGTTNPLQLLMDSDKTVGAAFAPDLADSDGDGLSNYAEAVIYQTNPNLADSDGDGLSDAHEVGLGRFSIIAGSFTWAQARAGAHARNGELACFPSQESWDRAMESLGANALDDYSGLWIGASDATTEGTWKWVNGAPFSFSQWGISRPSAATGNTLDYAEVCGGAGGEIGKWFDRSPTTVRDGYLLETGYATDPNVADADGDGLNDGAEEAAGSNPFLADTDGDGLTDAQEVNLTHTSPKLADTNNNGTNDALEDADADTLNNLAEVTQYGTDPLQADTDGDGLSDGAEVHFAGSYYKLVQGSFTYPQAAADAASKGGRIAGFPSASDYLRVAGKARQTTQGYLWIGLSDATIEGTWVWTDGSATTYTRWLAGQPDGAAAENNTIIAPNSTLWADSVPNFAAVGYIFERVGSNPLDPDTDGDGLTDGMEVNSTHSSPVWEDTDGDGLLDGVEVNTYGSSPIKVDTDDDGLNDRLEIEIYHSNPSLADTDGDGFDDLFEVNTGFNPALATSTPEAVSSIRTAVEFRFNAAAGVSYRIEGSTDLQNWTTLETDIIGQSNVVTRFYSTENQEMRYFRPRRN